MHLFGAHAWNTATAFSQPGSVAVTPGYSDTPGAWTELIASTDADCDCVIIRLSDSAAIDATGEGVLFELATGASSSEVVKYGPVPIAGAHWGTYIVLPLHINSGTRVAVRMTSENASLPAQVYVSAVGKAGAFDYVSPDSLVTVGTDISPVDHGLIVNTDNTWEEIDASTAIAFQGLLLNLGNADASPNSLTLDAFVGTGPAASEEVACFSSFTQSFSGDHLDAIHIPCHIPDGEAGTRLSVMSNAGTTQPSQFSVTLIPES